MGYHLGKSACCWLFPTQLRRGEICVYKRVACCRTEDKTPLKVYFPFGKRNRFRWRAIFDFLWFSAHRSQFSFQKENDSVSKSFSKVKCLGSYYFIVDVYIPSYGTRFSRANHTIYETITDASYTATSNLYKHTRYVQCTSGGFEIESI